MERNYKSDNKKQSKDVRSKEKISLADLPVHHFANNRIRVWNLVQQEKQASLDALKKPIQIKLPYGKFKNGIAFETSPLDIARSISKKLVESSVAAKVDGALWDLKRPLEADSSLELIKIDSDEGKKIFWNSSAFVLAQALERKYQALVCLNVVEEKGFYCDVASNKVVVPGDYEDIQALVNAVLAENQPIERLEVPKEKALEMFQYNKYKAQMINEQVADGANCAVYRCGQFIDLCDGPHLPNLGMVNAFVVKSNSSSYWQGNKNNDSLQRVHGISFAEQAQLGKWQQEQDEAARRDHRNIGAAQELFFGHKWAPGSAFFLPNGAKIYNKLIEFLRKEYRQRGFIEVISPNMFNNELWHKSGHDAKYSENMFNLSIDEQDYSLKPMNCPGHCLMFDHKARSYRELPLRFAEFGVVHRNEAHGALSGLTRVRRFVVDDGHIFCSADQISQEIQSALEFMNYVYGIFGFEFSLELSTRPEGYLGEPAVWDKAEAALKEALDKFGKEWKLNPGDGAFYGPKIDIRVMDALKRRHQCATIQLDFILPERFGLNFRKNDDSDERPVMVHRAICGSLERFIAILSEHCAGKWPFWLSPRQAIVVPVSDKSFEYAKQVQQRLWGEGFDVDLSASNDSLKRQIQEAHAAQYNFILVVGEEEAKNGSVNVRTRDNQVQGSKSVQDLILEFHRLELQHK